ncbi:uncharacterized protein yc1106_07169 [Curvularia clavata]|uniref:Uncharacterized protein n=1 Tax=Curvularia clavata TaxID=95742 RepID=A0A9Q8ZDT5_CURCL|nr:uncharacterized protein yc1106_07169 [Curvularia clavata]
MATTKAHPATQHFPPSPPPSPSPPSSARRRHRKKPDPFEQLAATPLQSAPSSPAASTDSNNTVQEEPLLTRILLTPLLFTSFLLSLFLVNYRNRVRRTQTNAPATSSLLTYLVPSRWFDPEPYQDPLDATWGHRNASAPHAEPHDAISPRPGEHEKRGSWHLHKKIRKVAKLEVGDALEMRGRVMVGMMAALVMVAVAACLGLTWCFGVVAQALRA